MGERTLGEKLLENRAAAAEALVDALLGTEFREPENVRLLGRLSWLRSLVGVCRERERAIEGDDPDAHREMMREVEALLADTEAALERFGYYPPPPPPPPEALKAEGAGGAEEVLF